MDTISRTARSRNMARIRSKDTQPELAVRSAAHRLGYRFRLHRHDLPGTPDLVFPGLRKAIFVHGCFWHCHARCVDGRFPKSRKSYWTPKLLGNQLRDRRNARRLREQGWSVSVIWECETARSRRLEHRLQGVLSRAESRRHPKVR
ncbi:MAG: DNA mismatch endonuclease Vsr [Acidobacteria bacterium]|nr:MAG: DNA mismatch endonuclease Vsr [Acidobacteriota bacterium]